MLDVHTIARHVFSYVLPIDFPPEPDDELDESETLALLHTARLSVAETATLWCYVETTRRLDPEAQGRARRVLDALALRSGQEAVCQQAVDDALRRSDGRPGSTRQLIAAPPADFTAAVTQAAVELTRQRRRGRARLANLTATEFEHPQDRSTLQVLRAVPGIAELAAKVQDILRRGVAVQMRADGLLVDGRSMPWLHRCYEEACRALDVGRRQPPLFLHGPGLQPTVLGVDEPAIVVPSMAVNIFDGEEMVFLLGRELGHVAAGHPRYQACAQLTMAAAGAVSGATFGLLRLPIDVVFGARLYAWSRASEYTADRAGHLACQNREAALRALMKLSGFPARHAPEIRTRSLVEQAERFRDDLADDALDRAFKLLGQVMSPSPYTVRRASELLDWIEEGGYDAVLNSRRLPT